MLVDQPVDVAVRIAGVMAIDPSAPAVHHGATTWTWGDLAGHGGRLDAALPGHLHRLAGLPVALVMRNRPAHVSVILGSMARHRCLVPVSSIQQPARLAAEVTALGTPLVVADAEDWAHSELVDAVREAGAVGLALDGHDVRCVVHGPGENGAVTGASGSTPPGTTLPGTTPPGTTPLGTTPLGTTPLGTTPLGTTPLGKTESGTDPEQAGDGTAVLMPTSGTTGPPKRVRITYRDLAIGFDRVRRYARSNENAAAAPKLSSGVAVSVTPLVHIAGLWGVLQFAVEGRRLALLDRFEPHAWADLVAEHRPAVAMLPPAALVMLLEAEIDPAKLVGLRAVMCGTAALSPDVEEQFSKRFDLPVLTTYGATEFPGGLVGWTLDDKLRVGADKRGSVGRARPGVEIRVVDRDADPDSDAGSPKEPDGEGVIEARTPQTVARGTDGWVRTTDLGRMDADGFLWVTGRADGAINRGGFKIMPETVETALAAHPAVRAAGVVGQADPRLGQVPVAAVEVRSPVTAEELTGWLRERLLSYQVPVRIQIVDELPRTPSMKISRPGVIELLEGR